MNRDLALKYQALVDGELSEREARDLNRTLEQDPEAQALVAELRATRSLVTANEPEIKLPETREFYWSKIQREIDRLGAEPAGAYASRNWLGMLAGWRRFLAPTAAVAVVAFLAVAVIRMGDNERIDEYSQHLAEIENLSEYSTSFSFRSDNMFVVWVQDTDAGDLDDQVDFIDNDETITQ
jgi:anti-sigma-K factor RskA